jgi:hypothetical protein
MFATTDPHVVLLGDSIFDNAAYTRGEPDVVGHLRDLLPSPWRARCCFMADHMPAAVLVGLSAGTRRTSA